MDIQFTRHAWEEFNFWQEEDPEIAKRIRELIKEIQRNPFKGTGKPEALRHNLKGFWSRRINREHRLVYKISGKKGVDQRCTIIQCRFHYND